jgi:GT2 family glycosyltransferase
LDRKLQHPGEEIRGEDTGKRSAHGDCRNISGVVRICCKARPPISGRTCPAALCRRGTASPRGIHAGVSQSISDIEDAMTLIPTDLSASRISDAVRDPDREIAASSRVIDLSVGIVVCVPCFRRPQHLRLTLESLACQRTPRSFAVVMVENDAARRESAPVAAEFLAAGRLQGVCLVEPRQGNCQAINAAFETAQALFPAATRFLMIDDDEIASPDWLELMVRAAEATGADVVGGPVLPLFDDDSKPWLARHPAFCPAYDDSGAVPLIYGCGNCLITRAAFDRLGAPAFDLRFNFLGGGDCDFFVRCRDAGMAFHWAAEAVITETVPHSRTRLGWIAKRGLRIGAINYRVQAKAAPGALARARVFAQMLGRLPLALVRGARLLATSKAVVAMHPVMVALGAALAAFGVEPKPYKASKIGA